MASSPSGYYPPLTVLNLIYPMHESIEQTPADAKKMRDALSLYGVVYNEQNTETQDSHKYPSHRQHPLIRKENENCRYPEKVFQKSWRFNKCENDHRKAVQTHDQNERYRHDTPLLKKICPIILKKSNEFQNSDEVLPTSRLTFPAHCLP